MKTTPSITSDVVEHVAKLANLTIPDNQLAEATKQFGSVLGYVSNIQNVNTDEIIDIGRSASTNYSREDVVDSTRTFTQEEALSNAPAKHKGYFLVNSILSE